MPRTFRPHLETLEPRDCPSAPSYHGGPLLQNPQEVLIFDGSFKPADQKALTDLASYLVSGPYASVWSSFGPGAGKVVATDNAPYSADPASLVAQEISSGRVPPPNSDTFYTVFLPFNDPGPQGTSYHSVVSVGNRQVPFNVAQAGGSGNPVTSARQYSVGLSHEDAETVTDPFPYSGWSAGSSEVADLSGRDFPLGGYNVASVVGPNGQTITATEKSKNANTPGSDPRTVLSFAGEFWLLALDYYVYQAAGPEAAALLYFQQSKQYVFSGTLA